MLQKYLLLRGSIFYFRWRVPVDLRSIIGSTELVKSLRTTDRLYASVRAGHFLCCSKNSLLILRSGGELRRVFINSYNIKTL